MEENKKEVTRDLCLTQIRPCFTFLRSFSLVTSKSKLDREYTSELVWKLSPDLTRTLFTQICCSVLYAGMKVVQEVYEGVERTLFPPHPFCIHSSVNHKSRLKE